MHGWAAIASWPVLVARVSRAADAVARDAERIHMTARRPSSILLGASFLVLVGCHNPEGGGDTSAGADATIGVHQDVTGPEGGGALPLWPGDEYISIDEVYARSQAGDPDMLLVNVVDPEYYSLGHIANSLKIPWDQLSRRLSEVDRARHVVVYCRKGVRSESAYTTLLDAGYPLIWVMQGGIEQWIAKGYPTVAE
jgi:rhodanese-related sulfurtransferase